MIKKVSESPEERPEILPYGTVLNTDKEGFLVSESTPEKIEGKWQDAVANLLATCLKHFGERVHSLYIRGSVSRGGAIENVSDVDALVVYFGDSADLDTSWVKEYAKTFRVHFPFTTGIDFNFRSFDELMIQGKHPVAKFLIKTTGACVYGEDLAKQLPRYRPGKESIVNAWGYKRDFERAQKRLHILEDDGRVRDECRWMMKRFLRVGFELVMEEEQVYTRDLLPCYEYFSKHYPDRAKQMHRALELAIKPSAHKEEILGLANDLGTWLANEASKKFHVAKKSEI